MPLILQNSVNRVGAAWHLSEMKTKLKGVIFRRTIRASYASLDLINTHSSEAIDEGCGESHQVALIQFHNHEDSPSLRSYIRRLCKLGSEVELSGCIVDDRFHVQLLKNLCIQGGCTLGGDTEGNDNGIPIGATGRTVFSGVRVIQTQKLDMVSCQQARERYYPSFDRVNKNKIKSDMHEHSKTSLSKKKKKEAEGKTGHGGGIGKRMQGEIVADFVIQLIASHMNGSFGNNTSSGENLNLDQQVSLGKFADRMVQNILDVKVDDEVKGRVISFLNDGSGVMDVAGGNGHVSLAMALRGVKSTVIDPRETVGKLPGRDRKILKKALKRRRSINEDISENTGYAPNKCDASGGSGKAPFAVKTLLPPPTEFATLRAWFSKRPEGIDEEFREGISRSSVENKARTNGENISLPSIPICTMCSPDGLLPSCSALIALHPDEATGDIVETAVKHRIPFVVLPCCVFSRLFPMRFKPVKETDGKCVGNEQRELVSTYEDLIEYLLHKDDSIRITKMGFEGANLALWSLFDLFNEGKNDTS